MELMDVIRNRRSIRKFKNDSVPDELIEDILEAARLAPSGSNLQPWRFVVVKSEETKKDLSEVTPYKFAVKAPVVIVCCADLTVLDTRNDRIKELLTMGAFRDVEMDDPDLDKYTRNRLTEIISLKGYLSMNVAIAIEHMVLRAADLGLGSCWIGRFDSEKTKEVLDLGDNIQVVMLLPIGYPDQTPAQRPRFSKGDIVLKVM